MTEEKIKSIIKHLNKNGFKSTFHINNMGEYNCIISTPHSTFNITSFNWYEISYNILAISDLLKDKYRWS